MMAWSEPPLGRYSLGTCRKCGEHKAFGNYLEAPDFFRRMGSPGLQPVPESSPEETVEVTDETSGQAILMCQIGPLGAVF